MKDDLIIRPFAVAKSMLHIESDGGVSLLDPSSARAEFGRMEGRVLATFPLSSPADAHPHLWEMHPASDEVLFMLTGVLQVDYSDGHRIGTAVLEAGKGLVVPRGTWHRLVLRQSGLLLALTAPQGTQLRPCAEGRP